jgi:hypothetical protein
VSMQSTTTFSALCQAWAASRTVIRDIIFSTLEHSGVFLDLSKKSLKLSFIFNVIVRI